MKELLKPQQLRDLITYDSGTGKIYWKERDATYFVKKAAMYSWNTKYAGVEAGSIFTKKHSGKSYVQVTIFDRGYLAHQVVFAIIHDRWPSQIDHINGDGTDNRSENIREVESKTNSRNRRRSSMNTSGIVGVGWSRQRSRWCASISGAKGVEFLGRYKSKFEACCVRKSAENKNNYHVNHGDERPL